METIITRILEIEWNMMDEVQNIGGRANCQDDWETFSLQRGSQLKAWNSGMLQSYVRDINGALQEGRNLLAEKYAYMMEHTSPLEYDAIRDMLPVISDQKQLLINGIGAIQVKWLLALAERYPNVVGQGRPIPASRDSIFGTSFETYLKSELATYSLETLIQYQSYLDELLAQGKNLNEMVLENTCLAYGYPSIDEAERKLSQLPRTGFKC